MRIPKSAAALISLTLLLLLPTMAFPRRAHAIAAGLAGALSFVPGLGQVAEGNPLEGVGWLGAYILAIKINSGLAGDLQMYNMYDAYRDARPVDGRYANQTALENWIAVFNPLNFFDPIGGPLLLGYAVIPSMGGHDHSNLYPLKALSTSFIGPGEEGLYRGFLFPAFSSVTGSKLAGALISSTLFGLGHTQYGAGGKITVGLFGLVETWQADRNAYDLRKNIFAHSWVDFFLLPKGVGPLEKGPTPQNSGPAIGARLNFRF